jgi:hypothetical protein
MGGREMKGNRRERRGTMVDRKGGGERQSEQWGNEYTLGCRDVRESENGDTSEDEK